MNPDSVTEQRLRLLEDNQRTFNVEMKEVVKRLNGHDTSIAKFEFISESMRNDWAQTKGDIKEMVDKQNQVAAETKLAMEKQHEKMMETQKQAAQEAKRSFEEQHRLMMETQTKMFETNATSSNNVMATIKDITIEIIKLLVIISGVLGTLYGVGKATGKINFLHTTLQLMGLM
ncbi:hypothetical protein AAXE64_27095 [Priestia megaterium]|uniref:hypothetical protein n=1 Tax=Priestia megaterium TaxID=1404 RepID=UPI003CFC80E0